MSRLFGPMGNAVRPDVLATTEMEEQAQDAVDDDDFDAWVAFCKAKKNLTKKERDGRKRGKSGKV